MRIASGTAHGRPVVDVSLPIHLRGVIQLRIGGILSILFVENNLILVVLVLMNITVGLLNLAVNDADVGHRKTATIAANTATAAA